MCDSCSDGGIANGPAPVASGGFTQPLANLVVSNSVTTTNVTVSSISIPGSTPTPGYVLGTTGTQIAWIAQSGGSGGSSQWTGLTGYPIYYAPRVGIGSTALPNANLSVTGNVYVSNTIQTGNIFVTGAIRGAGNALSNIQASSLIQPFANLFVSNSVTTTNSNVVNSNVSSNLTVSGALISNATNTTIFFDTLTIPYVNTLSMNSADVKTQTLLASGQAVFSNIIVSNLQVTNTLIITATNVQTTNAISITNQGTTTALYVNQNESPEMTQNVAEFWDHTQLAMVIDGWGNVAVHTASSPGYAFTVVDGAKIDNLTVTGSLVASGAALSSLNASNVTTGILSSALIYANTLSNISGSNVTTGINASNVTTGILSSARIYANTLSNISGSNVTTGINASNVTSGILSSARIYANTLSNIQGSSVNKGNLISNISASNVYGTVATAGAVTGAAQTNITSVGTLSSLGVSGGAYVLGNTGIGTSSPGYLLDVAGFLRAGAIVDSTSSIGTAGQVLTSTGSSLEWSSGSGFVQPLANLVVSNTVTSENVYTNLVQFSNTTSVYTPSLETTFPDSPYTSSLSSDGSTLVLGYTDRVDVYDTVSPVLPVYTTLGISEGWAVSINEDGTVLIAGDPRSSTVNIFRKIAGRWDVDGRVIGGGKFGYSVSVSKAGDKFLVCDASTASAGANQGLADSAYMYTYIAGLWTQTTTFPFGDPVSSVALSGDGTTCVFGLPGCSGLTGRISITKDLGLTYTTFDGDSVGDWFGYYVSSNYDGTRIVANSSNGDTPQNYIKIFTLE